jgi:hypothetical protein
MKSGSDEEGVKKRHRLGNPISFGSQWSLLVYMTLFLFDQDIFQFR